MERVPVLESPTPITWREEFIGASKVTGGKRTVETQTQMEDRNRVGVTHLEYNNTLELCNVELE